MANGRLGRDVQHLRRHARADFEGQVCVTEVDDNLDFISLDVAPNSGPYKGARLNFRVFLKGYPEDVPQVVCLNCIYHPNIDPVMDGDENGGYAVSNVCVSLLDEWTSTMSLDHVVMAVLFLLNYPQLDDILSPLMGGVMSAEEFHDNVRRSLRGQEVDGYRYPCLIVDDANAEEDIGYQKTNTCTSDKVVYKNANTSKMARFISTDDSTNTLTEGVADEFCDEKDRSDEVDSECTATCTLEAKREMYLLTAPNKWTVCYQVAQRLLKVLLFLCQKLS